MKSKIFIFAAIAALFLGSCAKEQSVESSEIVKQENPHLIPVSEAVESLDNFLSEIEEETTKSGVPAQKRRIRDVKTVYSSSVYTKSSSDEDNDVNELFLSGQRIFLRKEDTSVSRMMTTRQIRLFIHLTLINRSLYVQFQKQIRKIMIWAKVMLG